MTKPRQPIHHEQAMRALMSPPLDPPMKVKVVEVKPMMLLPPPTDACQECAVVHHPAQAHNAQSLFYQMKFQMEHGRSGTWRDAISHCPEDIRSHWETELTSRGVSLDGCRGSDDAR